MGVIQRVAERIALETRSTDPVALDSEARRLLDIEAPLAPRSMAGEVVQRLIGLGPLQRLIEDQSISDILVNGPEEIWVERSSGLVRTELGFDSESELAATVERVMAALGRRVDRLSPMVDGRLPDGSRIHVAVPPASVDYPLMAIRRFSPAMRNVDDLIDIGALDPETARFLSCAVADRLSIIVSGGTGAGKTTLLNILSSMIPESERIVTVEDAAELQFPGHVVRLEAHDANAEGVGAIEIRDLLRSALRLRPDRIVLGEVRGSEALDLITALNTGHRGSMSTVHANSPDEALWRLETLAMLDGAASAEAIRRQLFAGIDLIVQVQRDGSTRKVTGVSAVRMDGSLEPVDA